MTNQQIADIKARCEAATPGPWIFKDGGFIETHQHVPIGKVNRAITSVPGHRTVQGGFGSEMPNSRFIANARTDIPDLLDALEAAQAERNKWMNAFLGTDYQKLWAEREKWKHYAAALERAIKTKSTACRTCAKKPPQREVESDTEYCDELYDCIGEDPPYPRWQFDLDRFAGKES